MATYKFWKLGGGFKWKIDSGPSYGPSLVTMANVDAGNTVIDLAIGGAYRQIAASDTIQVEDVTITGTMEDKRDNLVTNVFGNNYITP